jgi:hypothetical protein
MKPTRKEPERVALRKLSEQRAGTRKERVTSAHLLAAIASRESPATDLLAERSLNAERLLRAARASTDDEATRCAAPSSRRCTRMGAAESAHLLIALLSERKSAGHRARSCGVDVNRLRVAAMNVESAWSTTPHHHPPDELEAGHPLGVARRPSGTAVPWCRAGPGTPPKPVTPQLPSKKPSPASEPPARKRPCGARAHAESRPARGPPAGCVAILRSEEGPHAGGVGQNLTSPRNPASSTLRRPRR